MTAAEHTRIVLTEYMMVGAPFKTAWASAMRMLPRKQPEYREWKRALQWARPAFEAHYTRGTFEALQTDPDLSELVYLQDAAPVQPISAGLLLDLSLIE